MNGTIFGIGPLELIFILILILLVFGPERLPELLRGVGNGIRRMREMYVAFTKEFQGELQPIAQDINEVTREIRQEVEAIREAADIRSILQPYADDINKAVKLEPIEAAKPFTTDDIIRMNTPSLNGASSMNGSNGSNGSYGGYGTNGTGENSIAGPSMSKPNALAHSNGQARRPAFSPTAQTGNVTLGDDNPWANVGAPVRSDKLDDDSPWRL